MVFNIYKLENKNGKNNKQTPQSRDRNFQIL